MRNTPAKKKNHGLRLLLFFAVVYAVYSLVQLEIDIRSRQKELTEVTEQCLTQADQNNELQRMLEAEDDTAMIERIAREKLNYAYPDEEVFYDVSGR